MENDNILAFFAIIFFTGFFIILPVQAADNIFLNSTSEIQSGKIITGTLTIPAGTYSKTEKVELSIDTKKESKDIYTLLNQCNNDECELGNSYYSATGSATSSTGTEFTVGIPFPQYSTILSSELSLTLSSSLALEPEIDLGKEGTDWIYPGTPGTNYKPAIGITQSNPTDKEELITENCEKLTTPKTTEIKLQTFVKASTKPTIIIFNENKEQVYSKECNNQPINNFQWLTCNLKAADLSDNAEVFKGTYYFCLSSPAEDRIKYTLLNETKQGYAVCSNTCSAINGDYLINIQPKEHNSYLTSPTKISLSNQDGEPFITKLAEYLETCQYTDYNNGKYCIVPVKIKSKENTITLSALEFTVLTSEGRGLIISDFATNLQKQEPSDVKINNQTVDISKLSLKAPEPGNYTLKAEFSNYEATAEILVTLAPSMNFEQTKQKFTSAYKNYQSSSAAKKEIYTDLGINMDNIKATLDNYEINPSLEKEPEIQKIAEKTPEEITIEDTLTIKPFLLFNDLKIVYPGEKEEKLTAIQKINEKIGREFKADLLKITYLTGTTQTFVLIKKTFSTQAPLDQAYIIENIPEALASTSLIEPIKETPITTEQQTLIYQFNYFTDEAYFIYRLNSDSLALIPDIITIISPAITPSELNTQLLEFDCPNNVCNPGEDYLSCPEDCACGNNKCDKSSGETPTNCPRDCSGFPWTIFIIAIIIILAIGSFYLVETLKPGLLTSSKPVQKIISLLHIKLKQTPSSRELNKLIFYIKNARARKISDKEIEEALLKKGWKQNQVSYAMKRTR